MKHQVIVADDSQTIQKVIAITLSSEPYELTECLDVKNLENLVSKNKPKLVLLDFNLSDDKTGYDLCKDIKNASPDTQVLYLFGTFDTIDEELISESGASNWIVKPFDGNKFINLCRALTQGDISAPEEVSQVEDSDDSNEEWVMDVPGQIEDEPEQLKEPTLNEVENKNAHESSMEDWGIEVPGVIGQSDSISLEIPDVIEPDHAQETAPADEMLYPESEDLEYPEIIEPDQKPTVELTSIDELKLSKNDELEANEDKLFESTSNETDIESLKEQIEDEQDDLWTLDEDKTDSEPEQEEQNEVLVLRETPSDFPQDVMIEDVEKRNDISDFEDTPEQTSIANPVDMDELLEKIRPMIEKIVRDECQKITEKVSWEVIPDLAENLIKTEIKNISKQVLDQ